MPHFTSPAILHGDSSGLKIVMKPKPDSPLTNFAHVPSALENKGVTAPMPVTTTRLFCVIILEVYLRTEKKVRVLEKEKF